MPYLVYAPEERNPSIILPSPPSSPSSSSKPAYSAKNLWDGTPFLNYFTELMKTYCGGGEFENCIFTRFFIKDKSSDNRYKTRKAVTQRSTSNNTDPVFMTPEKGSIFCHLNATNLHFLEQEISTLNEVDPHNYTHEQRWLMSMFKESRALYHRILKEEEVEFCERYLILFMRVLELACVNMKDWQVFMYVVGNTCKKISFFLRLLIRKNIDCCDWTKLVNGLRKVWYSSIDRNSQLFQTLTFYEKQLCREYFANEKPSEFQAILKLYSCFNLEPIPTTLNTDKIPSKFPLEIAPRYFVHDFFQTYFSVMFDIIKENLILLRTKNSTHEQLVYFYYVMHSYVLECMYIQCLLQDPTNHIPKSMFPKILKEVLGWFLHLSGFFERFLKLKYECFQYKTAEITTSNCATSSSTTSDHPFIEYKTIPLELENSFGALDLNDEKEKEKFNAFMNEFHTPLTKITHTISEFVDTIKHTSFCKEQVCKKRAAISEDETNSSSTQQNDERFVEKKQKRSK